MYSYWHLHLVEASYGEHRDIGHLVATESEVVVGRGEPDLPVPEVRGPSEGRDWGHVGRLDTGMCEEVIQGRGGGRGDQCQQNIWVTLQLRLPVKDSVGIRDACNKILVSLSEIYQ